MDRGGVEVRLLCVMIELCRVLVEVGGATSAVVGFLSWRLRGTKKYK